MGEAFQGREVGDCQRGEQGEVVDKHLSVDRVGEDNDEDTVAAPELSGKRRRGERRTRAPGSADRAAVPLFETGNDVGEPAMRAQCCSQPGEPRGRLEIGRPRTRRRHHAESLAGTGFEGTGFHPASSGCAGKRQRESNAVLPDLAEVVAVWHRLPDAARAGIVAMVRASGG